tara:strand:+ start:4755 stop:4925 length:171 start_codon:yes stop_codon:yes gene_type:complete
MGMKTEAGMEKMKRIKTRYHRVLWDPETNFGAKVVPNKKKIIPRKTKNKNINSIED